MFERKNVSRILSRHLREARKMKKPRYFPPEKVKIQCAVTTERRIMHRGYNHVDSAVNPMCLSSPHHEQVCFSTLKNSFFSASGIAIDVLRSTVFEISGGCCMDDWNYIQNKTVLFPKTVNRWFRKHRRRAILILCQHHGITYHHVIYEVLPRYILSIPILEADSSMLVAIDKSELLLSMLLRLGLDRKRIIMLDTSDYNIWYGAGLLIYPPPVAGHEETFPVSRGEQMQAVSEFLRSSIHPISPPEDQENRVPMILMMDRARQRSWFSGECYEQRCLKNFEELEQALEQRFPYMNFVVFRAGASLSDAISMFSSADVVIGIHGAGFQNVMFCKPGTTVIHIGSDTDYKWLADAFSLSYHAVIDHFLSRESRNFEVHVPTIVEQISHAMEQDGISVT